MPVICDNLCDLHEKLKTIDDSSVSIHLFTGVHDRRIGKGNLLPLALPD